MSHVEDVMEDHPLALPSGTMLNEYRIDAVLGQGGFGITYLAHDSLLDEKVAIKEYFPSDSAMRTRDLSARARTAQGRDVFRAGLTAFLDEARIVARFRHINVIQVRRFFEMRGTGYIVLNYETGRSLEEVMASAPLPEDALLSIMNGILCGLDVVHERAVLHRDLKPRNVIIREDGTPVLLDFGAARDFGLRNSFTVTQIASSGYSPPEQYGVGDQHGPWSDLYALGGILYRGVAGRAPVDALSRLRDDPLVPASKVAAGRYSAALLRTIDRMMQVDEARRPVSVAAVRKLLPTLDQVRTVPLASFPEPSPGAPVSHERTRRARGAAAGKAPVARTRRTLARPVLVAGALITVLLMVGGWVFSFREGEKTRAAASPGAPSGVVMSAQSPALAPGTDPPAQTVRKEGQPSALPSGAAQSRPPAPGSSIAQEHPDPVRSLAKPTPDPAVREARSGTPAMSGQVPGGVHPPLPSTDAGGIPVEPTPPAPAPVQADHPPSPAADRVVAAAAAANQGDVGAVNPKAASSAAQAPPRINSSTVAPAADPTTASDADWRPPLPDSGADALDSPATSAPLATPPAEPAVDADARSTEQKSFALGDGAAKPTDAALAVSAVPFLSPADRMKVATALARGGETALALSTDGKYGVSSGQDTPTAASEQAIQDCTEAGGLDCQLYAADGRMLWPGFVPSDMTSFMTGLPRSRTPDPPKRAARRMPGFMRRQAQRPQQAPRRVSAVLRCNLHCISSSSRMFRHFHRSPPRVLVQRSPPTLFDYLFGRQVYAPATYGRPPSQRLR